MTLTLTLSADGHALAGPFRVVGKATDGPPPRPAFAAIDGFAAKTDRPWLTVRPPPGPGKP